MQNSSTVGTYEVKPPTTSKLAVTAPTILKACALVKSYQVAVSNQHYALCWYLCILDVLNVCRNHGLPNPLALIFRGDSNGVNSDGCAIRIIPNHFSICGKCFIAGESPPIFGHQDRSFSDTSARYSVSNDVSDESVIPPVVDKKSYRQLRCLAEAIAKLWLVSIL